MVFSFGSIIQLGLISTERGGRSRKGARGPELPLILGEKKREMTKGRKGDRASKTKLGLPSPQSLDPPHFLHF